MIAAEDKISEKCVILVEWSNQNANKNEESGPLIGMMTEQC